MSASAHQTVVGIDIAATTFTAVWASTMRPTTFAQTPEGFAALQEHLATTTSAPTTTLVVMEATSSPWVALAVVLHEAGYHVSVVNPKGIHHYAKSLPRRAFDLLVFCHGGPPNSSIHDIHPQPSGVG